MILFKYYPKYRPRYRPIYHPVFQATYKSRFKPTWETLIEMRRQQRHAYAPNEIERLRPILVERWRQRHERYAEESKKHEEVLRAEALKSVPYRFLPRYRPNYRPAYRPVYNRRLTLKCKYRCSECGRGFLWLNDFLNHINKEHPGKQPLRLPKIHMKNKEKCGR